MQESADKVHNLSQDSDSVWQKMQEVLVAFLEHYWAAPSTTEAEDENVASKDEYEFTFVFEDAVGDENSGEALPKPCAWLF